MNVSSTPATSRTCLICNAPLPFNPVRTGNLCGRGECDWRYSLLRRQQKVCTICGRPLSVPELPTRICANPECQRTALADFARQVHERNQARTAALIQQEIEQASRLRDQVIDTFGLREPESFPLVVIPACTLGITRLPEQRRRAFRDHLSDVIGQAAVPPAAPIREPEQVAPAPVAASRAQAALGMACSRCQGFCCEGGGDHAYLKVETIRRYLAEHPDQRPDDVLAAYLDRVGHRTYQGSCIYHQADGCALPREMRSDLCNRHFCKALHEFQRNLPATGPIRAFFVAANYGAIQKAALVHENQMLSVPTI